MSFAHLLTRVLRRVELARDIRFPGSATYWNRRYMFGGNSGAGSYGRLAEYKAEFLNAFVRRENTRSVIEFGCGDGNQLALANYPSYFGVDVAAEAVALCRSRFKSDPTKRFGRRPPHGECFDLALSLDVIYHLVEDKVFERYMTDLFAASRRWVIIYSSHPDGAAGPLPSDADHVRHRRFDEWIMHNEPLWRQVAREPNRYPYDPADPLNTSSAEFFIYQRQPPPA